MPPIVSPTLVGRDADMDRLRLYLADALAGEGRVVFVSGEAGVGKSRLVREFADSSRERGVRTLFGRASQAGTATPFRPFAEALQVMAGAGQLNDPSLEPYRAGLNELLGLRPRSASDAPSLAAMEGIARLLKLVARPAGLLIVLEDLHWADPESLLAIEYLSDRVADYQVLLVATERSDHSTATGQLVDALVARRTAGRIELGALSLDHMRELAERALGIESVPQGLLDALDARAGGLPFLVEELLGAYVDAGGPDKRRPQHWLSERVADSIPDSLREIVRDRLADLNEPVLSVVFSAAVLGRAFDLELLVLVSGLAEKEVLGALRAAVRGSLLVGLDRHFGSTYEFRHVLAREAVLAEMLSADRVEIAQRSARAIEDAYPGAPGEWCERAAQLYEEAGDRLAATRLLQESARRALGRSALKSAESSLLHARELAGDDFMVWMGIDELLLDVYYLAGKGKGLVERAERLIDFLVGRYEGHLALRRLAVLHLKAARGALLDGELGSVQVHLGSAHQLAQEEADEATLAQVAALRAYAALSDNDFLSTVSYAIEAAAKSRQLGLLDTCCEALDALAHGALRLGRLEEAVVALSQMEEISDGRKLAVWKIRALLGLGRIDFMIGVDSTHLSVARELAVTAGAVLSLAEIDLLIGRAHLERVEVEPARLSLTRCMEAGRLHGLALLFEALESMCMLHALEIDVASLDKITAEANTIAHDPAAAAQLLASGRAVSEIVRGEDRAALEHLDEALRISEGHAQGWWRGLHVLLSVALRRDDLAGQDPQGSDARWDPMNRAYEAYAEAVARGSQGDQKGAATAMSRGDAAIVPGWRRHHARRLVADAALDSGWGDPIAWAGEALEFFDEAGLPGLAASCKVVLRRAGAPIRRRGRGDSVVPDDLNKLGVTSREMDVLNLVAKRLSNREIGARLFLSPRTIESHVASLQRKTGADTRGKLAELGRRSRSVPLGNGGSA